MGVRRFSAGLLLALLWPNTPGQPLRLQHFTPRTLEPAGRELKLYPSYWGFQPMSFSGDRLVLRTRSQIQVIDTGTLHVVRAYPFRPKATCAVGLDGETVVVLYGCSSATSKHFTVWRIGSASRRSIAVRGLAPLTYPVSAAVGDGHWWIARGNGEVDAIDLRTGQVARHGPARSLAKAGVPYTQATWLGEHRLGLDGSVVDVRTWTRHVLAAHARSLAAAEGWVFAYGTDGVTVYDDDLRLYRRLAIGSVVDSATIHGGVLYAQIGLVWELYDLRSGAHLDTVLPDSAWLLRLVS
jgi:hypothetical protein